MFDWNDQELAKILWGEANDSDDHIVPYPTGSEVRLDVSGDLIKKGWNEDIANEKPYKKESVALNELKRVEEEKKSACDKYEGLSAGGHSVDSGNALSLSTMSKSCQDSMDVPVKLYNCTRIFQIPNDDKDSDLIGYGWDNIGSFEDLDRIFSDDTKFSCTSLGNADALWSSSKHFSSSPEKRDYLSMEFSTLGSGVPSISEQCGKTEDMLDQDQPFATRYDDVSDLTSVPQNGLGNMNRLRHIEFKNNLLVQDKVASDMISKTLQVDSNLDTQNIPVPAEFSAECCSSCFLCKRSGEESEARPYQDLSKTWFSSENELKQLGGQYVKTGQSYAFLGINQQAKVHDIASQPYNNVNTPLFSPSGHPSSPANPLTMTPQEKIKKLRQRQQLRAMLAIQKQQKQFGHPTSESEHSICQNHTITDQMQPMGGNLEVDNGTSTILTLDTNSPLEQDYSGTMAMATDDCSAGNEILGRLQDVVAKLDVQLRLCIRDSLCRLAQSAMQRQYAKDTNSTMKRSENYLEFLPEKESNTASRSAAITPESETDTNQIDRTVAHLLFHRPSEFSGNLETTEAPSSAKLGIYAEVEMSKNSSCMNMSEYVSKCEAVQEEVTEVEASHLKPLINSKG
ncbi:protein LNK2-like isoform X2 [Apium graveolens]|uniref:protein LNK2-like isoform X2 n=1 Tax=Apium graveolens TaxID=4045 RepID=UPI003D7966CF